MATRSPSCRQLRAVSRLSALLAVAVLAAAVPAQAGQQNAKRHSGIKGVVLNTTCYGPCAEPPPPAPAYAGSDLTVTVTRVSTGATVATQQPADGHFRFRLKRGLYRVTAAISPTPQPGPVQPQAMPPSCWQGDSQEARVHRHRFTRVELHVGNVCIV
jgi:hypothetical protein